MVYGISEGNNQHSLLKNSVATQSDLATQMGISVDNFQNNKQLANMIPRLEEFVDIGIVTKTTALSMMRNLSEQEQEQFFTFR